MLMNVTQIKEYYSNKFVIEQLLKNAKNREVAGALWHGGYERRPNIIQYPDDVIQMVRRGVTSFHFSVERWSYPMQLKKDNYDDLRIGWDFLLDIDSKLGIEEAKIAVNLIANLLRKYKIKFGLKFSGRRGFHICIPWESFPNEVNYKKLSLLYPEAPRMLAEFIRSRISEPLIKELRKRYSVKEMMKTIGEIPDKIDPFYFVEVEKDWGNRHMFRAPYSLNEKTWLVSLPLDIKDLDRFSPHDAEPQKVFELRHEFFPEQSDACALLIDALDHHATQTKKEKPKKIITWERRVPEMDFPPCMKIAFSGLADGRKRSLFTLITFLRMMNWSWDEIENKIFEWNEKNKPPLPRNIVLGQLRWHQQNSRTPANCNSELFYKSIGICKPDGLCKKIKNPVSYSFRISKKKDKKKRGFSCGICDKEFKTMRSLKIHKSRVHGVIS